MLTKEELLDLIEWDNHELGRCQLYVPLFDREMHFLFFPELFKKPSITTKMVAIVNDILQIPPAELKRIKDLIWEECLFSFEVSDMPVVTDNGETPLKSYLHKLHVANKEDTFRKSIIRNVIIHSENDKFLGRYAEISVDAASEKLISIIIKDGRILDFDYHGTYLGSFDKHEDFAKKHRTATLNQYSE